MGGRYICDPSLEAEAYLGIMQIFNIFSKNVKILELLSEIVVYLACFLVNVHEIVFLRRGNGLFVSRHENLRTV